MVSSPPAATGLGDMLAITGGTIENGTLLLSTPFACTYRFPPTTFVGTVTTIWVFDQVTTVPWVFCNVTNPLPWLVPNPDPLMVSCAPTATGLGDMLVINGAQWAFDGPARNKKRHAIGRNAIDLRRLEGRFMQISIPLSCRHTSQIDTTVVGKPNSHTGQRRTR